MKKIYVVLSGGNTLPKRAFRALTDSKYDHVSVSFNEKLTVMYSFSKSQLEVPLVGGFVSEYPSRFIAEGGDIPVRVFALSVSDEEYMRVREVLRRIMTHPQIYTYNFIDKAASVAGGSFSLKRSYSDIAFVCRLLRLGNIRTINELDFVLGPTLVYDGTMNELVSEADERHGAEYFKKTHPAEAIARSAVYSAKLIGRKVYEMI